MQTDDARDLVCGRVDYDNPKVTSREIEFSVRRMNRQMISSADRIDFLDSS